MVPNQFPHHRPLNMQHEPPPPYTTMSSAPTAPGPSASVTGGGQPYQNPQMPNGIEEDAEKFYPSTPFHQQQPGPPPPPSQQQQPPNPYILPPGAVPQSNSFGSPVGHQSNWPGPPPPVPPPPPPPPGHHFQPGYVPHSSVGPILFNHHQQPITSINGQLPTAIINSVGIGGQQAGGVGGGGGGQFKVVYAVPLGPNEANLECTNCRQSVRTKVLRRPGLLAWLICGALALVGCWPCCIVPFCIQSFQDAEHFCPNCNKFIGKYARI